MTNSHEEYLELAQGTLKGFPERRYQMKHKIWDHVRKAEPFRFTLVVDEQEQEVELIWTGSYGKRLDGTWFTELIVCPVETLDAKKGVRFIHIEVNPAGEASFF